MNRPTEPNEILAMPDTERDAYAAEVCMGWRKTPKHIPAIDCDDVICWTDDNENVIHLMGSWQPSQPNGSGKAQCFDLLLKYEMEVEHSTEVRGNWTAVTNKGCGWKATDENLQSAVVTAAILCALAEKEK